MRLLLGRWTLTPRTTIQHDLRSRGQSRLTIIRAVCISRLFSWPGNGAGKFEKENRTEKSQKMTRPVSSISPLISRIFGKAVPLGETVHLGSTTGKDILKPGRSGCRIRSPDSSALPQPHHRIARRHRAQSLLEQFFHFLHRLDQPTAHYRQIG